MKIKTILVVLSALMIVATTSANAKIRGARLAKASVAKVLKGQNPVITSSQLLKGQNSVAVSDGLSKGPMVGYVLATYGYVFVDGKMVLANEEGELTEYSEAEGLIQLYKSYCGKLKVVDERVC